MKIHFTLRHSSTPSLSAESTRSGMFLVSFIVFWILFQNAVSEPRAILHIGPHKTSSSRTQGILVYIRSELVDVNFHLPHFKLQDGVNFVDNPKGLSKFAAALLKDKGDNDMSLQYMVKFLATSLHLNHNIILSSETFDNLALGQIERLKKLLKGFDVRVAFVYRDVLSEMRSFHFERNRFEHERAMFSSAFSVHLLNKMEQRPRAFAILSNYSTVFGKESLRIIDLHGATAAKKEIAHVLLCQIAGVLCNRSNLTDVSSKVFSNPSYSLIPAQVFSHFKAYVVKQNDGNCRFCDGLYGAYQYIVKRYENTTMTHSPPANISTTLSLLLPYGSEMDLEIRTTYAGQILEGNREANLKHMAQVRVQELDEDVFLEDVFWDNWIHSEYQNALTEGRLCNCTTV